MTRLMLVNVDNGFSIIKKNNVFREDKLYITLITQNVKEGRKYKRFLKKNYNATLVFSERGHPIGIEFKDGRYMSAFILNELVHGA